MYTYNKLYTNLPYLPPSQHYINQPVLGVNSHHYKRKRASIAKFIYGCGLPPSLVDSGLFEEMVFELSDGRLEEDINLYTTLLLYIFTFKFLHAQLINTGKVVRVAFLVSMVFVARNVIALRKIANKLYTKHTLRNKNITQTQ